MSNEAANKIARVIYFLTLIFAINLLAVVIALKTPKVQVGAATSCDETQIPTRAAEVMRL